MRTYFESDRAAADDDGGVAGADFHLVNAAQNAGERLDKRGAAVIDGVRHLEHVFHHDAAGDAEIFGVGAVVEEQVFAEIFLAAAAMEAAQAWRGIGSDDALADAPAGINTLAESGDFADDFVAENGGRLNHARVVAALPNFKIGAIGEREANAEEHFVGGQSGHIDFFDAQIFAAIENGGGHLLGKKRANYRGGFFAELFNLFCSGCSHA